MFRVGDGRLIPIALWIFFALSIMIIFLSIINSGNLNYRLLVIIIFSMIAIALVIPAIIMSKIVLARKRLRAEGICYNAEVIELVHSMINNRVFAKCSFVDEHGNKHVLTSQNTFWFRFGINRLRFEAGSFQRVRLDQLLAKVYIGRDSSKNFTIELFRIV